MMKGILDEDRMNRTEFSDFLRRKLDGMNYVEVENKGEEFTEQPTRMPEAFGTSISCHTSMN